MCYSVANFRFPIFDKLNDISQIEMCIISKFSFPRGENSIKISCLLNEFSWQHLYRKFGKYSLLEKKSEFSNTMRARIFHQMACFTHLIPHPSK